MRAGDYEVSGWVLVFLAAVLVVLGAVVLVVADKAVAQAVCDYEGVCQGGAGIVVCTAPIGECELGESTGSRSLRLCVRPIPTGFCLPDPTQGNQAFWNFEPGECKDVIYREAITTPPPTTPTSVTLEVLLDDTSTVIRTLHSGGNPGNPTYEVCGTSDATSAGTPAAGTFRLRITASNGVTYNLNSDGDGDAGNTNWWKGAFRSRMAVSSLTASSPPAGSQFAYGTAGNEQVTLTATHTQPNGDANVETARWRTRNNPAGTVRDTQATTDIDAVTSSAFASTIDLTYPEGAFVYDGDWDLIGNSVLTGITWTIFTNASVGRVSDTSVRLSSAFTADPSIIFSTDGTTRNNDVNTNFDVYNRVETVSYNFWLLNSRNEQLTKSMTVQVLAADDGVEDSQSKIGPNYSGSYNTVVSDDALNTEQGDRHSFLVTNTDQTKESLQTFGVSSLFFVDAHPQITDPLVKDDFPTEDLQETFQYVISSDVVHLWCHVVNVRKDTNITTTGAPVTQRILDPSGTPQSTITGNTDGTGWLASPHHDFSAVAPSGVWTADCSVTFNGNTGFDSELMGFVSAFTANLRTRFVIDNAPLVGETIHIYLRVEKNDQPIEPNVVPTITVSFVNNTRQIPPIWEDIITTENMMNVIDWTETVNGALYIYNFTIPDIEVEDRINPDEEFFNLNSLTFIEGAGIRNSITMNAIPAVEPDILTSGLELGSTSTLNVLAIATLVFLGVMMWARATDFAVQFAGAMLVWLAALICLFFATAWIGMPILATLLILLGGWMVVKAFGDASRGRATI